METIKTSTSNVEHNREKFEEPVKTFGGIIRSEQIWRDSNLLPETAPSITDVTFMDMGSYRFAHVQRFNDGEAIRNLIDYYMKLPLERVPGTLNCYRNDLMKDIITEDTTNGSYVPKIYINDNVTSYGVGSPLIDAAAGTICFRDSDFSNRILNMNVSISFYKYAGRKGTSVGSSLDNPDLPFRDNIIHFKDSSNENNTATFKIRGDGKHTDYILPSENKGWYDKQSAPNTGVILLQENLEDTLWKQNVRISGGEWITTEGVRKVYKYNASPMETGEVVN